MINQCPHCNQILKFSEVHRNILQNALAKLMPGQTLQLKCPRCKKSIIVDKQGNSVENRKDRISQPPSKVSIVPPKAPDLEYLTNQVVDSEDLSDDLPSAMILLKNKSILEYAVNALEDLHYQIVRPVSIDAAIDSLRFKDYEVIVYSGEYDDGPLQSHDFHKYMSMMSMMKRRYMFYIVISPDLQTMYDLQALTLSANLVINNKDIVHMPRFLAKGLKDSNDLFGPYEGILKKHGKK